MTSAGMGFAGAEVDGAGPLQAVNRTDAASISIIVRLVRMFSSLHGKKVNHQDRKDREDTIFRIFILGGPCGSAFFAKSWISA
jgi:hypothetical protein